MGFNDYDSFMSGLVGGENEPIDRVFTGYAFMCWETENETFFNSTGQITSLLTGSGLQGVGGIGGAANSNIQYGFESTCPGGINQNTALLATAAAIGDFEYLIIHIET